MGVEYTLLQDASDQYDTPSDGEFRMYYGGTKLEDTAAALDAKATVSLQNYCTRKTLGFAAEKGHETASFRYPLGVGATDELLLKISELSGVAIPDALTVERGRLVDALADSQSYLHGKRYAIYGDPDFVYSMARFVMETGGEPTHCLATNGTTAWAEDMKKLLASSPFGKDCNVWAGRGPVAPALDPVHRAGRPADRQLLRQVPAEGHRHSAGAPRLPDLRPSPPSPLPGDGLSGRPARLTAILDKVFDKLDADALGARQGRVVRPDAVIVGFGRNCTAE